MNKGRKGRGKEKKAEHRVQLSVDGGEGFLFFFSQSSFSLSLSSSPTLFFSLWSFFSEEKETRFEDRRAYVSPVRERVVILKNDEILFFLFFLIVF